MDGLELAEDGEVVGSPSWEFVLAEDAVASADAKRLARIVLLPCGLVLRAACASKDENWRWVCFDCKAFWQAPQMKPARRGRTEAIVR